MCGKFGRKKLRRRGKRKCVKSVERNFIFGGVNVNGARGKWGTIRKAVRDTGASVWFMQETKCQTEGSVKLLFNSESDMINSNMSDSNIGGRKKKSCINHIWVLNSIIHEQLSSKSHKPLIFQQYDYQKMFDSMNLKEACSDLFDIGLTSEKLQLVYNANKNVGVKVKTPSGTTRETIMGELVMQGDTWARTMYSVMHLAKSCLKRKPHIYSDTKDMFQWES